MVSVKFIEVGRNRQSWTATMKTVTMNAIVRQVKQHASILSREIEVNFDQETRKGTLWVGGFRKVGDFEVLVEEGGEK